MQRTWWVALVGALLFGTDAWAQQPANDGFQRLNGQMYVVRNGQRRPMTHDARLPTGTTITKEGFVLTASGQRTELQEGQGCDLRGRPVAVATTNQGLVMATPATYQSAENLPAVLAELLGVDNGPGRGHGWGRKKKGKKHKGYDD